MTHEEMIKALADVRDQLVRNHADRPLFQFRLAASMALYTMLTVLDGWIEGAHENHEALGHRGENRGGECWTQFHPADIRNMINDAARELGVAEFATPAEGQAKEDGYR